MQEYLIIISIACIVITYIISRLIFKNQIKILVGRTHYGLKDSYQIINSNDKLYKEAVTLFDKAEKILGDLLEKQPTTLAFQLQMANLTRKRGQTEQAIETLAELYLNFPGNKAIALEYGKALLEDNDPKLAETASIVLRQQLVSQPDDPALYALYARAANLSGDKARSTEAIAESYYQRGGITEAITQLEGLSKQADLDYYQRARVNARLIELRIEVGETDQPEHEG